MEADTKQIIVIIGNAEENMATFEQFFGGEYALAGDADVFSAAKKVVENRERLAAVVIDVADPQKSAYAIMDMMGKHGLLQHIPVFVMITKDTTAEVELTCYRKGASAVIRKPYGPLVIKERVNNWIELYQSRNQLEARVKEQSDAIRKQFQALQKQEGNLRMTDAKLIDKICAVIEFRNLETAHHIERIRGFSRILATTIMPGELQPWQHPFR